MGIWILSLHWWSQTRVSPGLTAGAGTPDPSPCVSWALGVGHPIGLLEQEGTRGRGLWWRPGVWAPAASLPKGGWAEAVKVRVSVRASASGNDQLGMGGTSMGAQEIGQIEEWVCVCVCAHLCVWTSLGNLRGFPGSSASEESACNARDPGSIPGSEDPLEKETATHSSILGLPWCLSW